MHRSVYSLNLCDPFIRKSMTTHLNQFLIVYEVPRYSLKVDTRYVFSLSFDYISTAIILVF